MPTIVVESQPDNMADARIVILGANKVGKSGKYHNVMLYIPGIVNAWCNNNSELTKFYNLRRCSIFFSHFQTLCDLVSKECSHIYNNPLTAELPFGKYC